MTAISLKPTDRVQHRAWHWMATIISVPEVITNTSVIVVKIDGRINQERHSIFSLITNPMEFLEDWSEESGAIAVRATRKNKKPRRKR